MLNGLAGVDKVYNACGYADLQKGINGLARMVQQQFESDLFTNRCSCSADGAEPESRGCTGKRMGLSCLLVATLLMNQWLMEQEAGETLVISTPRKPTALLGSVASAAAVAHIIKQKFVVYPPLYRLERKYERIGLKLSR